MIKVLFVSDNEEKIREYGEIFGGNAYEFLTYSDEKIVCDLVKAAAPEIIIVDAQTPGLKNLCKKIKSISENAIIILLTDGSRHEKDLEKYINAYLTPAMGESLTVSTINLSLRTKNSLDALSDTNRDLADSLYRLNALYDTSSQFAGTLDKDKLMHYMIQGLDKSLSFSLSCTLSFADKEPVLLINSIHDLSDELVDALKLRTVLNYNSIANGKDIDVKNIKVVKKVKHHTNYFNFNLFQFDNMFAPIATGKDLFGCVEVFKEASFTTEDATCFQTTVQQVSLPLKGAALYQEIVETNKKLEKLERMKSEFISIVSHELRTPLTSIKSSLDVLGSGKCSEKDTEKFITMARRNVQRLGGIINDLLDLSKIEAGKMDFQFKETNIHGVIEYVKSTFSEVARGRNLTLISEETTDLPKINADPQRLEQVLTNLVSNALKFTPDGKTITIKSSLINAKDIQVPECFAPAISKLDGDYIMVTVQDEGIGLAEKDFLEAFDKFAQIENSLSRKVGGSGLGLPIARQLIDAHHGAIWCESELEVGSRFYFVIPLEKSLVHAG